MMTKNTHFNGGGTMNIIGEKILQLCTMYGRYGKEMRKQTHDIFSMAFDDMPPYEVVWAIDQWARTQDKMPTVADIRKLVNSKRRKLETKNKSVDKRVEKLIGDIK